MLRALVAFLLILHGLIHFMGFAKAFEVGNITQLSKPILKHEGILWFITAVIFVSAAVLFLIKKEWWWMVLLPGVIISQLLIISVWSDAKYGTIANVILLIIAILSFGNWQFERKYKTDVAAELQNATRFEPSIVTEQDLKSLPLLVQNYLKYVGVINKPRVNNFKIVFHGNMRDKEKSWFPFTSEQYNAINSPTRLFFMKAKMFGIIVPGYHAYKNAQASMDIRLFGFFPIVNKSGLIMNKAETVTLFNDMCLFAPASLINKNIQWQPLNDSSVKAVFTNNGISISAIIFFNKKGELINFISDDRYDVGSMKQYRFSTPVREYKYFNGYNLPSYGEAIWHYPEGPFSYGQFYVKDVIYNIK